jgi:uncharacterized protein with NRDE domain
VVAANRDEQHDRASAPFAAWPDAPQVLGGRDLAAGGTWLGLTATGRFAAVTNVREPRLPAVAARSRGALAAEFLRGSLSAPQMASTVLAEAETYGPFNLLLSDGTTLLHLSNRSSPQMAEVTPGVHGLSNASLDTPWPKTRRLVAALDSWCAKPEPTLEPLFAALADDTPADDEALPDTGVGLALERLLSPAFIRGPRYGTRASTVLYLGAAGGVIEERRFGPNGALLGQTRLTL